MQDREESPLVVIGDLRVSNRSRMLNNGATDGVDPILLLLLRIGDEVHRVGARGKLERAGLVDECVLRALNGEATRHGNDAALA
ncbi:hypothetical protein PIB30_008799 [Stylosanthes scabra]|uniref:Uncharacterized protein n=1 Tax=Stylosanthes scabra TaxID=79078 RepID=A0ABU6X6M0_9FABA|nr:hypothetical protein [Stylosanthes scabra]